MLPEDVRHSVGLLAASPLTRLYNVFFCRRFSVGSFVEVGIVKEFPSNRRTFCTQFIPSTPDPCFTPCLCS